MPHNAAARCGGSTGRAVRTGLAFIAMSVPAWTHAQTTPVPNPREAQAERPRVATHAYAVATGYVELEAGFQRQQGGSQANRIAIPLSLLEGSAGPTGPS